MMTNLNKNKPDFYYEDLEVIQVDLVDKPATRDTFLVIRSEDGAEEQIPVIRTDLTKLIDTKNKETDENVSAESLVTQSNKVTREDVTMELTEVMAKLEELNGKANETLARAESLIQNIENKEVVREEPEVVAEVVESASDVVEEAPVPEAVEEAPVEAPVESEAPEVLEGDSSEPDPVEAEPEASEDGHVDVVREMFDKMTDSLVKLSEKLDKVMTDTENMNNRINEVERSMLTPNAEPVDETEEPVKVERQSFWGNLINF